MWAEVNIVSIDKSLKLGNMLLKSYHLSIGKLVVHSNTESGSFCVWLLYDLDLSSDYEVGKLVCHQEGFIAAFYYTKKVGVLLGLLIHFEEALLLEEFKCIKISESDNRTVLFLEMLNHALSQTFLLTVRLDGQ